MKIDTVQINGFKKLVQFSIDPEGKSVEIKGRNGQGKSSIIDAIWVALTGKEVPGVPVNKDSIKAEIVVGLDSGHTVTLKFSARGGKSLVVEGPDGAPVKAPTSFLESLIGKISFDPFDFVELQPSKQRAFLVQLLGLDLSAIDARKEVALKEKREAESDAKAIEKQIEDLANIRETKRVDVKELMKAQEARNEKVRMIEGARHTMKTVGNQIEASTQKVDNILTEIENARKALAAWEARLPDAMAERTQAEDRANRGREVIGRLEAELALMPDNSQAILDAGDINAKADAWERKEGLRAEYTMATSDIDTAKQKLEDIENDRKEALLSASFPVQGLAFTDEGVTFNGLPFDKGNQCMSDILRVGVAIAVAQDPALKIVRIKDGSLLDTKSRADLLAMLAANGFQAFIETVADSDLQALTIEEVPA
jgi:DNA repair exonuclease SbcCD ATPase subunit